VGLNQAARRNGVLLLAACVIALTVGGMLLLPGPYPRLAILAPVAYAVGVVGNFAAFLILLAMMPTAARPRLSFVLAVAFCANAVMLLGIMLVLPMLPHGLPVFVTPPQFAPWLFFFWHALAVAGAIGYLAVRRTADDGGQPNSRFLLVVSLVAAGTIGVFIAAASLMASSVTIVEDGVYVGTAHHSYAGPVIAAAIGLAALCAYRVRAATVIEQGFALGLLCVGMGFAVFLAGGPDFGSEYFFGRLLVAAASLVVLEAAVRSLIASRTQLNEAEWSLERLEAQSAHRAGRVHAIWDIVSLRDSSGAGRVSAILQIATAALRPGKPMLGLLAHQVGARATVDSSAWSQFEDGARERIARTIYPGATRPIDRMMASWLDADRRSQAWDDLDTSGPRNLYPEVDFKSFIGSRFETAGRMSFLGFASTDRTTDDPYAEDDLAYVEVIASFFAERFQQQQQFERIKFQIEHDELTGLENRVQFRTAVRAAIEANVPFTVAFINLDGFRTVNERHGNRAGDAVLVEVAARLRRVAAGDLLARMGSDEFAIMQRDGLTPALAAVNLQRYTDIFNVPFSTGPPGRAFPMPLTASIGAARFPADGDSAEALVRRAALALETAKARGGAVTLVFEESMESLLEATRLRVVELRDGIANNEFAVLYQPTFSLATRRITGAEALVRWNHPGVEMIGPAQFINFAERNGLIAPLTRWVFDRVTRDISKALPGGFRLYVNLAAPMLEDVAFIADVNAALRANPLLADHLAFEVTESAAMENVDRSMNTIALFRRWGLHVAIDDFGTGHSSLAYLKELTVDLVKIDRSFIAGLPRDQGDREVVDMLLRITSRFGFAALAEGVETEAQAEWLLEHGCRFGQGFLVAEPRPFDDLIARIRRPLAVASPHAEQ
jgi:diguanylate cyclase (GGDEF)-like protein